MRTGKITHVFDQFLYNRLRAIGSAGTNGLNRAFKTELVSVGIERFRHTIGVENEAIIALEPKDEICGKPIEHISENHSRRLYRCYSLRLFFVKQRRILPGPRERDAIALMIQNEVGHTDEHVFLDIRIKLAVYFSQNIGRGG